MTKTPEEETPTPWGQTRKKPSSLTHHRETLTTKLQGLPKGSRKGRRAPKESRLAKSRQEETLAEEPPKGGCQGQGVDTKELPKGSHQGRETAGIEKTTHQEGTVKAREPQETREEQAVTLARLLAPGRSWRACSPPRKEGWERSPPNTMAREPQEPSPGAKTRGGALTTSAPPTQRASPRPSGTGNRGCICHGWCNGCNGWNSDPICRCST